MQQGNRSYSVIKQYDDGDNTVLVETVDDLTVFQWRLIVNNEWSDWSSHYPGILCFKGYYITSAYWEGTFPEFVPFKVVELQESPAPSKESL